MDFFERFLETFLEGSVDHVMYRDYIVNRRAGQGTVLCATSIAEVNT